jgi:hypothetical protein
VTFIPKTTLCFDGYFFFTLETSIKTFSHIKLFTEFIMLVSYEIQSTINSILCIDSILPEGSFLNGSYICQSLVHRKHEQLQLGIAYSGSS